VSAADRPELDGGRAAHYVQSLQRGLAVIRAFGADTPSRTL
jgi:IclR family transcriptional regulator, pca regulon regulatory protein